MTDRAVQRLAVLREQLAANSVNMQETAAGPSVWQDVPQVFHDFRVACLMPWVGPWRVAIIVDALAVPSYYKLGASSDGSNLIAWYLLLQASEMVT
jgi:hypothetical protein